MFPWVRQADINLRVLIGDNVSRNKPDSKDEKASGSVIKRETNVAACTLRMHSVMCFYRFSCFELDLQQLRYPHGYEPNDSQWRSSAAWDYVLFSYQRYRPC